MHELVVVGVQESRGPKSDQRDAFGLAEQLRIGAIETRVYKNRGAFRRPGQLARGYGFVVGDTVRVKNPGSGRGISVALPSPPFA